MRESEGKDMLLFWLLLAGLAAAAFLPVEAEVEGMVTDHAQWGAAVSCLGRPVLRLPKPPGQKKHPKKQRKKGKGNGRLLLRAIRKRKWLRQLILRSVHLQQLTGRILLSTESAASTALLTGAAWGMLSLLPPQWRSQTHLTVTPDFFSGKTYFQGKCMVSARLGMIVLCAAGLLMAWLREKHNV